jgi:hypothetical protein
VVGTAEETIGWLRHVRPGSVIGPQQQYMKDMQVGGVMSTKYYGVMSTKYYKTISISYSFYWLQNIDEDVARGRFDARTPSLKCQ